MTNKKKQPIVCVEWEDAFTDQNTTLEEILKYDCTVTTIGILVFKNKKHTVIKCHEAGEGNNDYYRIPTSLIRRITKGKV